MTFTTHVALAAWMLAMAPPAANAESKILRELELVQQALFDQVAPAVVFIKGGEGYGSGFIVSRDGLVLTNAHVVGKRKKVDVVMRDGRRLSAMVLRSLDKVDLALVQLPLATTEPLRLGESLQLRVGQWVGAVGHGHGGIWTFNTGMISNIYPAGGGRRMFQTQIPLNPGASGGPIFDRSGAVIGVVTAGIVEASSINFGIAMDTALDVLPQLVARCDCLVVKVPDGVPVFVDGIMRGTGPRVVVPVAPGAHEVVVLVKDVRKKISVQFPQQRVVALGSATQN